MPILVFECQDCQCAMEYWQSHKEPNPPCAECGGENVKRVIGKTSFALQGSGWYRDGYSK